MDDTKNDELHSCRTVDVSSYLTQIENEISSIDGSTKVEIKSENKRSVIRTLLGMSKAKDEFDALFRQTKTWSTFDKTLQFMTQVLQPHFDDMKASDIASDFEGKIPNGFTEDLEVIKSYPLSKRSARAFQRLARGQMYRGKVLDMVQDLAPHLVPECSEAMRPLSDSEVFVEVVNSVAQAQIQEDDSNGCGDTILDPKYIQAARTYVYHSSNIYSPEAGRSPEAKPTDNGKTDGIQCERQCFQWLEQREYTNRSSLPSNHCILQNVGILKPTQRNSKHNEGSISKGSGMIWVNGWREKLCAELDAVVLLCTTSEHTHNSNPSANTGQITEVWEAKYCINPTSLHDAMTKKLPAIRSIIQDKNATITYNGSNHKLDHDAEDTPEIIFGLFGLKLLPPYDAVRQLLSATASYLLSKDIDVALEAAENGHIEIPKDNLLKHVEGLKRVVAENDVQIILKIAS